MTIRKGTEVFLFHSWDDKGTFTVERFTVGSWGKKQAHLVHPNGKNYDRRIYTARVNEEGSCGAHVYAVGTVDPNAKALELAAAFLVVHRAGIERCIASATGDSIGSVGYRRTMRDKLAALHEPRVLVRDERALD